MNTTAHSPFATLPELANRLRVSPWSIVAVLRHRPDLAERVCRSGGRRMFDESTAQAIDDALRERGAHRYVDDDSKGVPHDA